MSNTFTAIEWDNGKVYFFKGDKYIRYDIVADRADRGYPKKIKDHWPGLWEKDIDAAINWGNGKAYFFKGNRYIRYDIVRDRADRGYPKKIKDHWPGLWIEDIDAAINWGNGKAYFFNKGDKYIRYNIATDRADRGYPKKIKDHWPGLWIEDIDAAINWGNGKAYFFRFKENDYIRYDIAADRADRGYPKAISNHWPGLWDRNIDPTMLHLRIHGIKCADSDGRRERQIIPGDVQQWITTANAVFRPAGLVFEFDPSKDWEFIKNTTINNLAKKTVIGLKAKQERAKKAANKCAKLYVGKIVIFFTYGPQATPGGGGHSGHTGYYVKMSGFSGRSTKGLAHEFGHYFGLPHTFAKYFNGADPEREIIKYLKSKLIKAVINWGNGKAYFFNKGDKYIRYDIATDCADRGYPKKIKDHWPGLWEKDIDAAVNWENGKAYFFKGDKYIRYNIVTDRADRGYPKKIKDHWPGLWEKDIDAAINWGNGKAYFFKGNRYIRYNIVTDRADRGYPKKIKDHWPGLWVKDIDAVINWGNGKAYFFKRNRYIRYDIITDRTDRGYPKNIKGRWPGLWYNKYSTLNDILDGDQHVVRDTPPDVGKKYFITKGLDPCDETINVVIQSPNDGIDIAFSPDRHNVMSYDRCNDIYQISQDQIRRIREVLLENNRKHLIVGQL